MPTGPVPRPVEFTAPLIAFVALTSALALTLSVSRYAPPDDWQTIALASAVILALSRMGVHTISGTEMVWSATVLLQLAMVITFGVPGAFAGAAAETLGVTMRARVGWFRTVFNVSNFVCSNICAWTIYEATSQLPISRPICILLAGLGAGVTEWFVNNALLAGVFAAREQSLRPIPPFVRSVSTQVIYFALYGLAAVAFPPLHADLGSVGVVLLIGPIVAAQLFLIQLDRTATRHNKERQAYIDVIEDKNKDLQDQRIEVVRAYDATLIALTNALDARDKETQGHSRRVVEYSRLIGESLGVDDDRLRVLSHGALLHDIGKIGVPDSILLKPDKLTDDEWELMRRHPEIGEVMVRDVDVLREARRIILHHHERWNGSGYPRGLKGFEIDQGARIFAVADACDAMTQNRPYRRALGLDHARHEIRHARGITLDPDAVDAFLALSEHILASIQQLRTPPGLDLLIDSHARERYLTSIGLGAPEPLQV